MSRERTDGRNWLLIACMRALCYAGLFGLFFGLMAINNWTLYHLSRTSAVVLLTYACMTAAMRSAYGGYEIGRKKTKPIVCGMALGAVCTDLITYLALEIMNTNANKNASLQLFGEDFPYLLACIALQIVFLAVMVDRGNALYFRLHPPKRCLVILGSREERAAVEQKIGRYKKQWRVTDVALFDAPNLTARIERAEVVFLADVPEENRLALMRACYSLHRDVLCKAQLQDVMTVNARQVIVDDSPYLEMDYHKVSYGQRLVKRCMDVGVSALAMLVLSPLWALIALRIKMEDGGPVIYRQERATLDGRVFVIWKFRTMRADKKDHPGGEISARVNDERITRVGRLLRRLRLDETPQLVNIIRGDMSLVGPRPEMLENVDRYKHLLPAFVYREKMKAGLTGLAQIEGRYNTTPEDKLMLDLMYIESFSLWGDVKLLLRTLTVLFKKDSTQGYDAPTRAKKSGEGTSRAEG